LQVEYSDKGKGNNFFEEKISEEEIESESRSIPSGTIGESQDVMSENIEFCYNKLGKKHGTFTYNPKSSCTIFEHKDSDVSKCSRFAVIRERISLPGDNKHTSSFKKCYDRLFREFKEKLVQEYA